MDRIKPLNDFVFKKLFAEEKDKELLIGLLNAILKSDIVDVTIDNPYLLGDVSDDKLSILDIKATTDSNERINIEVQLLNQKNMVPRTLYYWSKLYSENFESGDDYKNLQRTVAINFLTFELQDIRKSEPYHTTFSLREEKSHNSLTNLIEIHFIEFPKLKSIKWDMHNSLHRWLLFLQEETKDELLKEALSMDSILKKADQKLAFLSSDSETRNLYNEREKAISDERSRISSAKEVATLEIVKKMVKNGFDLAEAATYTEYTEEELLRMLQNEK